MRLALTLSLVAAQLAVGLGISPIAHTDADSTAELQAKLDALKPGDTLMLTGSYSHSGVLVIRVPNVTINGNGATLNATNDPTSSVQIKADGVTVKNLNLTAPSDGPRYSSPEQDKIFVAGNNATLSNITITGSAATGVFVLGSSNFLLDRITVRGSRADGIHMTDGANNGVVNNVVTERTGDDGVAVISYTDRNTPFAGICHDIQINNPTVNGTTFGRGISVGGGENIVYRNVRVSETWGAGVYVTTEGDPFYTQATNGVQVLGGTVTGANYSPVPAMGAIAVYGEHPGFATTNVTIAGLSVVNTHPEAQRDIRVSVKDGGAVDNVALSDIRIQQQGDLPALYSNVPPEALKLTDVTLNGRPVTG
jgi:hypothetical protein